jgi:succinoglycan biosynthesis protein ExoL
MEALALERPDDVEIVVAGYIQDFLHSLNIPGRIEELANVTYLGEFRSPDDLPSLYSDIDILWGCYPYPDSDDHNWRWARTNRFYESCFYQKPIIALRDSGDALVVEQHDIGPIVHGPDIGTAVEALSKITRDDLTRWQENISKLPRDVYVYTHEGEELATLLTELVEKSNVNP